MYRLTVVDNFYNDPSQVANLATFSVGGCGGSFSERSKPLNEINLQFHLDFSDRICSIFNIDVRKVYVYSILSKQTYNPNADKHGMIHVDGRNSATGEVAQYDSYRHLVGGTIFLSESYDRDSGVNFYDDVSDKTDKEKFDSAINSLYNVKSEYLNGKMSLEEYDSICSEYNKNFKLSASVSNVYNRMVAWKCGTAHQPVMTKQQDVRLVHNFYIISMV